MKKPVLTFSLFSLVLLFSLGLFYFQVSGSGPITHDNTATAGLGYGANSGLTFSKTNAGSDLILFVAITTNGWTPPSVTSVTYAGQALTSLGEIRSGGGQYNKTSLWYKVNPATGANNVAISTANADYAMSAVASSYTGYLSGKLTAVDTTLNSAATLSVPILLAGDFNSDNVISALDYSILNTHYLQNYSTSDVNKDGLVNSLDYAVMKNNWNKVGQ